MLAVVTSATNLSQGNYTVTVTDANSCSSILNILINQPTQLTVAANLISNTLCFGSADGSLQAVANGGTINYNYAWSTGDLTANANGLIAGTYTVTATDANGCTATNQQVIAQPTLLVAQILNNTPALCNGDATGSLTAGGNGGTPPYNFLWNDGTTANTLSNLAVGNYTVTVTDANACTAIISAAIAQPTPIVLVMGSTSANCGAANGTASVIANGGSPGYAYAWSPSGGASANASGLIASGYTVTVTDANGCTSIGNVVVPNATGPTVTLNTSADVTCFGGNNGTASVNVANGLAPFVYQWSPNVSVGNAASNLSQGNYTVTVTDANSCSSSLTILINQPTQLTVVANLMLQLDLLHLEQQHFLSKYIHWHR